MLNQFFVNRLSLKKQTFLFALFSVLVVIILAGCSAQSSTPTEAVVAATAAPVQATVEATPTPAQEATATLAQPSAGGEVSFSKDVLPLLQASCANCHGIDRVSRGFDVTSYDKLMAGSINGAMVVPGDPDASKLVTLIASGKMPKRGEKLTPEQLQLISDWVKAGAPNN